MKIGLLFDYDGVLVPIDKRAFEDNISIDLSKTLDKLRRNYAIGIISGRDCRFLHRVIPGLHGYACIDGLEIHGGGYIVLDESVFSDKPKVLVELSLEIKNILKGNIGIHISKTFNNIPVRITIYWDVGKKPDNLGEFIRKALEKGLVVLEPVKWGEYAEFIEIRTSRRNKADAVRVLKTLLGLDRVVYFGDSLSDIPAFNEADVSILVKHEYNKDIDVKVDYIVERNNIIEWLSQCKDKLSRF